MTRKGLRKIIQQLLLICNNSKQKRMELCCSKNLSALSRRIMSKQDGDSHCLNCLHSIRTNKTNLNPINEYVKINFFTVL